LSPTGGSITVDGVEIANLRERQLGPIRRQMGVLFQGGALFDSLTVGGNLAFPLRESGMKDEKEIAARVAEALEIVHLPGEQDKLPPDLSGGMRKRVALARAIVHKPACVLFDEPHTGLDPINADSIDHLIKDLQRNHGVTNIVVTHELRSVFRTANRVAFLDQGRIHWTGTPEELRETKDPVLRAFIEGDSGEPWE
jgi:phospholipid/cholesterol/gamma-HCH transport system ATP-binding protein